jgi:hypothetical protein
MRTYFLPREQVEGYLCDLARRLKAMGEQVPMVWCPIGRSGEVLSQELKRQISIISPDLLENFVELPVKRIKAIKQDDQRIVFDTEKVEERARTAICGQAVFLFDSSVHSGHTMQMAHNFIQNYQPLAICSYALILKQNSIFIPAFWGLMIDPHDRALFLLDQLPNNRLHRAIGRCHIRKMLERDFRLPRIITGIASLDAKTWEDRHDPESHQRVYLFQHGTQIRGFISCQLAKSSSLVVTEIGIAGDNPEPGFTAGSLVRFAETVARHTDCEFVEIVCHISMRPVLEDVGYKYCGFVPSQSQMQRLIKKLLAIT